LGRSSYEHRSRRKRHRPQARRGRAIWFLGSLATIKASKETTDGRVAVIEHLVPQLIDAGHEVIGTSRSPASAKRVRALGAKPLALDLLDARAVRKTVLASEPDRPSA
jgi:hypothetical protein